MEIKIYDDYPIEARTVREEVFIVEQGFSYDYDEIDDYATHFVLFDGDTPVGACRVFRGETQGEYILGRLAVKKEYRGRALGSMLLDRARKYVETEGGEYLALHSQLQAKEFYSKNGFQEYGEIELEEGCPHIWMRISVR